MRIPFAEAKQFALLALYEALYNDAEHENLAPDVIYQRLVGTFSLGYTKRALGALLEDGLIRTDGDLESPYYTLTQEGLFKAEQSPSLSILISRWAVIPVAEIDIEVPAADRIVRLNHNQIAGADQSVTDLLASLEKDNGDPDQPGLRERMIGQLKAGRELLRAGEFKAYLLYEVLIRALNEIVSRYKNGAIVALANALLGALVSQMLQATN